MAWSKVENGIKKPFGWWYHKIMCEIGYWIYATFNSVRGQKMYYNHLDRMWDKYKINLYGKGF